MTPRNHKSRSTYTPILKHIPGSKARRSMKLRLALLLLAPVLSAAELKTGVVIIPVANMYSSASEDSDVVSQAIYGSNVALMEESHGWAKVRTSDQYTGWMRLQDLRRLSLSETGYAVSDRVAQVSSLLANIYRETDVTAHRPLLTVPYETRLEVIARGQGDNADWLQVRLPDERSAWIQAGDVDL